MAKISQLPALEQPTGDERLPVIDATGATRGARFRPLVEAAAAPSVARAEAAAQQATGGLKPIRFPNSYPQPSFADGVLPNTRSGTPALVPVTSPALVALGAVNGIWNSVGTASLVTMVRVPVAPVDIGKNAYMSFYVRSAAALPNSFQRSAFLDDANAIIAGGLAYEQELIETGADYYVYRCAAVGVIPAGTAFLGIGRALNQRAVSDYITGITYGISKWPLSSANFFYDKLDPVLLSDPSALAKTALNDTLRTSWINVLPGGDFVGGDVEMRSGSSAVDLAQPQLTARGYSRGVQWRTGGNDYARYPGTVDLTGQNAFGGFFLYSENPANLLTAAGATLFQESDAGVLTQVAGQSNGIVTLSPKLQFVWMRGQITAAGTKRLIVGTPVVAADNTRFATGFVIFLSATAIDPDEAVRQVFLADKARNQARNYALAISGRGSQPATDLSVLSLNGAGVAYVESTRSGHKIRNTFVPFPEVNIASNPCRLNLVGQFVDGVELRSGDDDIAPDHTEGTTLGGNHGYTFGRCTASGHGKTAADEGNIATLGGVEYVIVKVESASVLLLATRLANTAPPVGTYAHATGNFTVTLVTGLQWYPPHGNYSIGCFVDGVPVTERAGRFAYTRSVQFVEVCDILARQTIIDWWIANGGARGGHQPQGAGLYRMVTTYRFDCDGQLTISRSWVILKPTLVTDLMGVQVGMVGAPKTYQVPGAEPFVYDGETLDYGRGVAANRTLAASGMPSIFFTSARLQVAGEYAHRVLSVWDNYVFAAGLLPIGDAAYGVRRARLSTKALEIRGNTGKLYFRVLDKGAFTAQPGEVYEVIGFRHVLPRKAGRPTVCTVRHSDHEATVYIDWTDFSGIDQIALPADLVGRSLSVADKRNAALLGTLAAGSVTVNVNAAGNHAYLVLQVGR
jgi:hypothetical protein